MRRVGWVVLAFLLVASGAFAATINVPDDYPTIQAAIDAAAQEGDTIQVAAGTYDGNLVLDGKSVSLLGAWPDVFLLCGTPGSTFWRHRDRFGLRFADGPPHYVIHNGVMDRDAIQASRAACYRGEAGYEARLAVSM